MLVDLSYSGSVYLIIVFEIDVPEKKGEIFGRCLEMSFIFSQASGSWLDALLKMNYF